MSNRKLANALHREDQAEAGGSLPADERTTCHPHQSWTGDCADQHTAGDLGHGVDERVDLDYLRGNHT
ncbi:MULTISPECIES: hypothetical protein [unclassified Streptomyces]|uniref:hypothetical protein n=1 Tax=unclassified Streptomyces TaxID=2593676 RepID=UPI002E2A0CCF|nr:MULTISPECIES: hypothetical protein [unclassified Streptomyces]